MALRTTVINLCRFRRVFRRPPDGQLRAGVLIDGFRSLQERRSRSAMGGPPASYLFALSPSPHLILVDGLCVGGTVTVTFSSTRDRDLVLRELLHTPVADATEVVARPPFSASPTNAVIGADAVERTTEAIEAGDVVRVWIVRANFLTEWSAFLGGALLAALPVLWRYSLALHCMLMALGGDGLPARHLPPGVAFVAVSLSKDPALAVLVSRGVSLLVFAAPRINARRKGIAVRYAGSIRAFIDALSSA